MQKSVFLLCVIGYFILPRYVFAAESFSFVELDIGTVDFNFLQVTGTDEENANIRAYSSQKVGPGDYGAFSYKNPDLPIFDKLTLTRSTVTIETNTAVDNNGTPENVSDDQILTKTYYERLGVLYAWEFEVLSFFTFDLGIGTSTFKHEPVYSEYRSELPRTFASNLNLQELLTNANSLIFGLNLRLKVDNWSIGVKQVQSRAFFKRQPYDSNTIATVFSCAKYW